MSSRYSSSHAVVLAVRRSDIRRVLHGLLCCCGACAIYLLHARGYLPLAALMSPVMLWLLYNLGRDRAAGTTLYWQNGIWVVEQGERQTVVTLLPGTVILPWLVHFAWMEGCQGRRGELWLFADSAGPGELRSLRRRLVLER